MRPATERGGLTPAAHIPAVEAVSALSAGQMLTRINLANFRNYDDLYLRLDEHSQPGAVVLAGPNGAGKTNLLEAISYLAPGRGIRGARLSELNMMGAERPWTISARIRTSAGDIEVGTGLQIANGEAGQDAGPAAERRTVRIDGHSASPAGLARIATILWLTPRMDRLFVEGTAPRRRFLDRMVQGLHPSHGREIAAYERAMRERLNLLTQGTGDAAWLSALERQMAEHGVAIAAARIDAIGHLAEQIRSAPVTAFPKAGLALDGMLEIALETRAALQVEEDFAGWLAENRGDDARAGRTRIGPHRSDLLVVHAAKGRPAGLCSTGEQKALLVGLLLANAGMLKAREARAPILLLDEIAAHMDEPHRAALFCSLLDLECQTWLTGTDMALFSSLGPGTVRYAVNRGRLRAAP